MKTKSKNRLLCFMMAFLLAFGSLGTVTPVATFAKTTKKISISSKKVTLDVGKSKAIKMKNVSSKVKWTTSNKKIVTIKSSGKYKQICKITAKKAGIASVKAKVGKKTYTCKVTVKKKVQPKPKETFSEDDEEDNEEDDDFEDISDTHNVPENTDDNQSSDNPGKDPINSGIISDNPGQSPSDANNKQDDTIIEDPSGKDDPSDSGNSGNESGKENEEETDNKDDQNKDDQNKDDPSSDPTKPEEPEEPSEPIKPDQPQEPEEPKHEHDYKLSKTDPTCEENGMITYTCACGDVKTELLPAIGHDWETVTEKATCKSEGKVTNTCKNCQKIITTRSPKADHEFGDETIITAPTCEEDGESKHTCIYCGLEETIIKKTTGHDIKTETTPASCNADGKKIITCQVCDYKEEIVLKATGHQYDEGVIVTEPTEDQDGKRMRTCQNCGTLKFETIKSKGHNYGEPEILKAATCTQNGLYRYTCTDEGCNESYTETVLAYGHDFDDEFTIDSPATCISAGCKSKHCSRCNERSEITTIPKTQHSYDEGSIITQPTCVTDGSMVCTCINKECGKTITKIIPALGHDFNDEFTIDKIATCMEAGSKSKHCNREDCDEKDEITVIPKTQHSYDRGHVTLGPTCTECGSAYYICNLCGYKDERDVPKLDHTTSDNYVVDTKATCTSDGTGHYYCMVCNQMLDTVTIPAGHTIEQEESLSATCVTDGYIGKKFCSECGEVIEDRVVKPATGHSKSDTCRTTQYQDATCTESGIGYYYCTKCDQVLEKTVIPPKGHDMMNYNLTCSRCDKKMYDNMVEPFIAGDHLAGALIENGSDYEVIFVELPKEEANERASLSVLKYIINDQYLSKITKITFIPYSNKKIIAVDGALFAGCSSLTTIEGLELLDFRQCKNMKCLFSGCHSLKIDLKDLDVTGVTDMTHMFRECDNVDTMNLSALDTSKVTDMYGMFENCSSLTSLDLSKFDTSNVTDMSYMFNDCSSLTSLDLSNFDTSNVTDMSYMFKNCSSLTSLDISNFNTDNVTSMYCVFKGCSSFTSLDLSNFDTSNVTNMGYMFYNCSSLTSLDLSNFDTSNATDMNFMFYGCKSLSSLDLSNFNTSNVTSMAGMFENCSLLTSLDLSSFDTSKVNHMGYMFEGCTAITELDLRSFNTQAVSYMSRMFFGDKQLIKILVTSNNWNISENINTEDMFTECKTNEVTICD